ncbi:MAG: gliding motility-associated C-terminal domain-containing protein, partial [Bacteroidia bacterium]
EILKYSWIENNQVLETGKNFNSNKLMAGKHNLTIKAENEYCNDSKSLHIEIKPKPKVDFLILPTNTTTIMQPNFWFVNKSGVNQNWLWDFGTTKDNNFSIEQNPKYSYTDTGNFTVSLTGTDIFGCASTVYKTVVVRPDLLIFIPNAFTPNNKDEEKNNVFSVSLENYNSYTLEIYDRWGHKLFYSEDPKETWDGKSGNIACTPDVYFYSIKIMSITNHLYLYRGTITLIK